MDVVGSLHLAASATSRLRLGTAVTNLVTCHPAVVAATFATLHHVTGGRALSPGDGRSSAWAGATQRWSSSGSGRR